MAQTARLDASHTCLLSRQPVSRAGNLAATDLPGRQEPPSLLRLYTLFLSIKGNSVQAHLALPDCHHANLSLLSASHCSRLWSSTRASMSAAKTISSMLGASTPWGSRPSSPNTSLQSPCRPASPPAWPAARHACSPPTSAAPTWDACSSLTSRGCAPLCRAPRPRSTSPLSTTLRKLMCSSQQIWEPTAQVSCAANLAPPAVPLWSRQLGIGASNGADTVPAASCKQ